MIGVFAVVGRIPRGTFGDAPSNAREKIGPKNCGLVVFRKVGGDGGSVVGRTFVARFGFGDDLIGESF